MTAFARGPSAQVPLHAQVSGLMADISQFLSDQKHLGNDKIFLSDQSRNCVQSWANPRANPTPKSPSFRCQGPVSSPVVVMDSLGTFYEGKAGRLLVKILAAIHLSPEQVYICTPISPEMLAKKIQPDQVKMILAFGEKAAQTVTGTKDSLSFLQGKPVRFCGIRTMPLYHPEQLLQDPALKRPVWEAIKSMLGDSGR